MKLTVKKAVISICILSLPMFSLCGCTSTVDYNTSSFTAMDTYISLKAECDNDILSKIQNDTEELSNILDAQSDSELSRLNNNGKGKCSSELCEVANLAARYYQQTNGAFNPCLLDVKNMWNINSDNTEIPKENDIKNALSTANCYKININENDIALNGQKLDFGGIAKGIAADNAVNTLKSNNVTSAILSFGGTIAVVGQKNNTDNWTVAVQNPRGENDELLGTLSMSDKFISTSGDYQQYEIIGGKRYHHIFGQNGYPADNGIMSVTVICDNGAKSDALSTAFFVMGLDKAFEYIDNNDNIDAVIVTEDKTVTISSGIRDKFILSNKSYTVKYHE